MHNAHIHKHTHTVYHSATSFANALEMQPIKGKIMQIIIRKNSKSINESYATTAAIS